MQKEHENEVNLLNNLKKNENTSHKPLRDEEQSKGEAVRKYVSKWAINNNISQRSLDSLLSGIRSNCLELPKSAKTLLNLVAIVDERTVCDLTFHQLSPIISPMTFHQSSFKIEVNLLAMSRGNHSHRGQRKNQ